MVNSNSMVTIRVGDKESKMLFSSFLSILNGATCYNIDGKADVSSKTLGELTEHKGTEEESVRNALLNLKHFEDELELIDSIKTELGIGR